MSNTAKPDFLSIEEVATYLRVTPRTVRRWIHDGALTAYRFGRQWRLLRADVAAFAEQGRRASRIDVR